MKAILETPVVKFEIEATTQKDMFKAIAEMQEIFSEKCCGLCKKPNLRYVVRTVGGNDFPELHCNSCGALLAFGYSKQKAGAMFPIRKLVADGPQAGKPDRKKGEFGPHNGWTKWKGKELEEGED